MFEQTEDSCQPKGRADFEWTAKMVGFGQLSFYVNTSGEIVCDNEMMSKKFIKKILCKMVDDCELADPRD